MEELHRLTIRPHTTQHLAGHDPAAVTTATTITVAGAAGPDDLEALASVLVDPLLESGTWDAPVGPHQLDIGMLPGVTETAAAQVIHAARLLDVPLTDAAVGRTLDLPTVAEPAVGTGVVAATDGEVRRRWANPVIERWSLGQALEPSFVAGDVPPAPTEYIALPTDDDGLARLSRDRGLALDLDEMRAIRDHFDAAGRAPTDAELETLAQTWSEHCAHKSFRAEIEFTDHSAGRHDDRDGAPGESLLAQLRRSTTEIGAAFVVSAFDGNAGIVQFTPDRTYALKCETHNHPSAIEPFGGANTGVGGVIRDIIGAHHRPIACTDILCFGPPDTPAGAVPDGVLAPQRIIDGVVAGVADYGNKIGLPTVAGGVLYDPAYVSNPLVFAGCIGVAPADRPPLTGPHPGDRVVLLGGRTGRDGIRGATFSSMEMDATTGDVAGASVQIGDPIVEKLVGDLLAEAWDLYTAITDCGAGGLSSAVGELADGIGADVELTNVPLKYTGLAAWEIWLSEAQERMVIAVDPGELAALAERAQRHGVELSDLGTFTGDARLVVRDQGVPVVDLDTTFLHHGRPRRRLPAELPAPDRTPRVPVCVEPAETLLALLAHPNIATKATVVRRYDHEIRGATVIRPLTGERDDGPSDGVVLVDPGATDGIVIGIGANPWYGLGDPERMAWAVVDEAIRNVEPVAARSGAVRVSRVMRATSSQRRRSLGRRRRAPTTPRVPFPRPSAATSRRSRRTAIPWRIRCSSRSSLPARAVGGLRARTTPRRGARTGRPSTSRPARAAGPSRDPSAAESAARA